MAKKKEEKQWTKEQAHKKIQIVTKDLYNIRFKKMNKPTKNSAQYNESKKSTAWINTTIKNSKWPKEY